MTTSDWTKTSIKISLAEQVLGLFVARNKKGYA